MANSNSVSKITIPHYLYGRSNASRLVNHAKLMGEKNIGPKVRESSKTFWKTTVVRNKMNGTVQNVLYNKKIELSKGDMKKIIKLVLKMHKEGYYHGNISTRKVMWKELEDGKNFRLVGFKKMGKIEDKLDYKDALSNIKSKPEEIHWMMDEQQNHKGDLLALYVTLRAVFMIKYNLKQNYNYNSYDGDFYYDLIKEKEHNYKFSKWFRETVEAEVKNLNNKNKKRNNNNNNNLNNFRIRDSNRKRNNNKN